MSEQTINGLTFNKLSETQYSGTTPVDGQFYVTPDNALHTTGNENFSGIKCALSRFDIKNSSNPNQLITATNIDLNNPPASANAWSGIQFNDVNNTRIAKIEPYLTPSGDVCMNINVNKTIDGTTKYNTISLRILNNGTLQTYMQDKLVKCFITESYISGTNWYRVYSDGWIEQGGQTRTSTQTVTFLKPFSNIPTMSWGYVTTRSSASYDGEIYFRSVTALNFISGSRLTDSISPGFMWRACGY